jgi:hypothetical protein
MGEEMISIGIDGIDIGEANFEVTPSLYNYTRLPGTLEPTAWHFTVKDKFESVQFKICWDKEFNRFILTMKKGDMVFDLDIYVRLNDQWANMLRTIPRVTMWVSDEPMSMLAYPDGRVIPIQPLRDAVRAEVLAGLQKFIDNNGLYPNCEGCQDDW